MPPADDRRLPDELTVVAAIGFDYAEGEIGVVARDLADYLWLLADGFGPYEAVQHPDRASQPNADLRQIAEQYAPERKRSAHEVIAAAQAAFPHFEDTAAGLRR